ncbi:MAG: hypothetical protein JNK82_17930 [Myxococcaceae bacterium]|nr:hypothetical protein [Myxococcaceae bacterium]
MFKRLSNSWTLVKASAAVLSADKELIVFPIISVIGVLLVSAGFIVPVVATGAADQLDDGPLGYVVVFAFYFATYFVIFFCNSALVGAALIRLRGGDPTVADGLRIATSRIGAIVGYALVAATVGMILRLIERRAALLGRIVAAVVGLAWNLATFLAVPVLVTENIGPIEAVRRSTALLKKTWGEQVVGNSAVGAVFTLAIFLTIFGSVPLFFLAASTNNGVVIGVVAGSLGLIIFGLAILNATLSSIYSAAVYLYAAEGSAGTMFDGDMVREAFKSKNG